MKKKKLNYAGIPKKVLNMVMGETYGLGDYTLKQEIDGWGEDLICQRHNVKKSNGREYIEFFHAWSATRAFVLVDSPFGDRVLLGLERNPPSHLVEKKK